MTRTFAVARPPLTTGTLLVWVAAGLLSGAAGCRRATSLAPGERAAAAPLAAMPPSADPALVAALQHHLDALRAAEGFPGATAAILMPDGRLAAIATGLADREQGIAMTPESRMPSGSIGKTFVAATALALAHEGKLDLDGRIERFLGDREWFPRLANAPDITVRHLITHSAGLGDHVYAPEYAAAIRAERAHDPDLQFPPERQVGFILDRPALFVPGQGHAYTDTGYILLGLVLERVLGRPYYDDLVERFLTPLGLTLTSPANTRDLPGLAPGYLDPDQPFGLPAKTAENGRMAFHPGSEWTGGGLCTNASDLVRWVRAYYEGEAMPHDYRDELLARAVRRDDSGERLYGIGLYTTASDLGPTWGHGGWFPGWRSRVMYFPDHRLAVAVQVNTDIEVDPDRYTLELARLALDHETAPATATIYRDEWGIPHIYAADAETGLYASGWAQAEDRLEQILKNYLLGTGEYADAFGAGDNDEWVRSDLESRTWDHYATAQRRYHTLHPALRRHLAAFVSGINDYMAAHRAEVPAWWGERAVDAAMPVAFSRQYIWSWPAGQAADDLRAVGLTPNYATDERTSNEIALAPHRTTFGAAALIIDPHLAWFGRQRYWELRLHAGEVHISGFATAGFPYVNLGHNRRIAWAHTTGGPDTADVYELTLDARNPRRYRFDGRWRELSRREIEIPVRGEAAPRRFTVDSSHFGPIVARRDDRAWAAALAYADEIGYLESKYWFMVAADYRGAQRALEVRQIMPQNVMVADTAGNIYYQRTGRVPIRPDGIDPSRPLDGTTSKTAWLGIHPTSDLISLLNPEAGYLQNCNVGPDTMLAGSPLQPERYRAYLYNQPRLFTHRRGSSALARLEATQRFDREAFQALALDDRVYQAERWVAQLQRARAAAPRAPSADAGEMLDRLAAWNGRAPPTSNGALLYYAFRHALLERRGEEVVRRLSARIDDYLLPLRAAPGFSAPEPPGTVDDEDLPLLLAALDDGAAWMRRRFSSLDATFGDAFRVGRLDAGDDVSWPVGGGSLLLEGMATVRSIGFGPEREDGTRWGERGQTSTEVVFLTDPIRSFTQPPIGQSDRPDSPHFRDQAERLFSPAQLKPTWFERSELLAGHVRSEQRLTYRPRPPTSKEQDQ